MLLHACAPAPCRGSLRAGRTLSKSPASGGHKHSVSFWNSLFSQISVSVLAGCRSELPGALTLAGFGPSGGAPAFPVPPPSSAVRAAALPPLPEEGFGQGHPLVLLDVSSCPSSGRTRALELLRVSSGLGQPLAPCPNPRSSCSQPALCCASPALVMQVPLEARQNYSRKKSSYSSGGKRYYPASLARPAVGR